MNVTNVKQAIRLCRGGGITPYIHGHKGMGKSSSVRQLCQEMAEFAHSKLPWGFVDFRASQIESSDLRGLPDRSEGRTVYFPPDDLPHGEYICLTCIEDAGPILSRPTFGENGSYSLTKKFPDQCHKGHKNTESNQIIFLNEGILFLDELNRADDDVLQATFQLVLDRQLGRYILPTGWSVVVAGNYQQGYMVNTFNDPAFLDRFCHIKLTADKEYMSDWADYMTRFKGQADRIMQFVAFDTNHLMGKVEGDLGFSVQPSPRSWEFVARILNESERGDYTKDVLREVLAGIIGLELTTQFERFSVEVTPSDVLDRGLKTIEGKLKEFNRNQLVGLVWGVASNAKERFKEKKGREEMMENALDFMEYIAKHKERDLAVMFGRSLVEKETQNLGGAVLSNQHLAKMAAKYKGSKTESWIAALNERPELQKLMSKVSYGT